ncbi:uncharacterized protein LOC113557490 isoform X2 [Rhopalosiphum maidis]|nr:uncharacterized protein LOC113557490 isoform X2 [Rhopalosiphum maidis]XP_026818842.1 uncharacterized protein LOC113557490 isoform X2 [Rhopalosiphum maidis]
MPRNRVKATNRGTTSESTMQKAALLCLDEHMSERSVAKQFNICHVSLNRYIKKYKLHRETGGCLPAIGYRSHNKIFNDFQEKQFAEYVQISADMYFGLNLKNIRKLAYEFAVKLDLTVTKSWKHNNEAGPDWITDFLKRNPSVSICLPKTNNISRAIHFNPANVKHFMDKYESILLKYKLQAHDIYNLDEIRVTFVQNTKKIVASQGNKHVKVHSKDNTITMCLAINATGNFIPPMYIFSKAANNFNFIQGVEFLKVLKQFAMYVKPSVDKKVLILLDSHESHLYLPVIDFCKESGILLLSFPPHYSHKFQPLNRSIYKPFNQFLNQYMSDWLENNPGKKLESHIVPSVSTSAFINAAIPRNIIDGFFMSGIWPLNREAFAKDIVTPAVTEDINNMVIDNVDEESINYVTKETRNRIIKEPINYVTKETKYYISEEPINYVTKETKNRIIEEPINYITTESKNNNIEEPINYVTNETKNSIIEEPINYVINEIKNNIIKEPKNHIFITPHILRPKKNSTHPSTPINDLQPSTSIISPEYIKPYLKPVLQDKKK